MMLDLASFLKDNPDWKRVPDLILNPPDAVELRDEWGEVDVQLLERCLEYIRPHVTRGAHYWLMRIKGSNDKFAAMIALQSGPALSTDDTFFQGQKPLYDQFGSQKHLDRYLLAARKRGFKPSPQATYFPNLARFPGDPEAFVTRAQGRSYIRKLCEQRGWACDGAVNVNHREPESDPLAPENCKPLGDDIIHNRARQMVEKDPSLKHMNRRELREKILHKHGPSK